MNNLCNFDEFLNEDINWTIEMLQDEADKYEYRKDFRYKNRKAYDKACRINMLDKLFKNHKNYGHIKNSRGALYWTKEKLQKEIEKYKTRKQFRINSNSAYVSALSQNLVDELFKDKPNYGYSIKNAPITMWNDDMLQDLVNKYSNRNDFEIAEPNAYQAAYNRKNLNKLFRNHTNKGYSEDKVMSNYWTKERLQEEADKYKTRTEFKYKNSKAYDAAIVKKLLDELFKNHENNGYSDKQKISGYWTKERLQEEADKYETREDFKNNSIAYGAAKGKKLLDELFKNHPNKGYADRHLSNLYWTKERLQAEADKYETRLNFKNGSSDAYGAAKIKKLMNELFKDKPNQGYSKNKMPDNYWTKERLQAEADKYETKNDFRNSGNRAYGAAKNKKLLDDLFKNHPNKGYKQNKQKNIKSFESFTKNNTNI